MNRKDSVDYVIAWSLIILILSASVLMMTISYSCLIHNDTEVYEVSILTEQD